MRYNDESGGCFFTIVLIFLICIFLLFGVQSCQRSDNLKMLENSQFTEIPYTELTITKYHSNHMMKAPDRVDFSFIFSNNVCTDSMFAKDWSFRKSEFVTLYNEKVYSGDGDELSCLRR